MRTAGHKPAPRDLPSASTADELSQLRGLTNNLFETPPSEFGRFDLGLLNLACAPSLPGSESLDVTRCLTSLDRLTAFVKAGTERNLHRMAGDPEHGHSEPKWRMAMLVTLVKRDFGASYSPSARDDLLTGVDA